MMGHGASTSSSHVKKVTLNHPNDHDYKPGWARSNSDGCIIETGLSSSKTKIELMAQQVTELQERLKTTEESLVKTEHKRQQVEQQMTEVEATNFELRDRVIEMDQLVESLQAQLAEKTLEDFSETLAAKNQYIEQLQKESKQALEQTDKMKMKYKKRLNAVKIQIAEVKQEASLNIYKLKDEMMVLEEENSKLITRLDRASSATNSKQHMLNSGNQHASITDWEDSRTKVILELSNQLSIQEEKIRELESILKEKELLIGEQTKYFHHDLSRLKMEAHSTGNTHLDKVTASHHLLAEGTAVNALEDIQEYTNRWKSSIIEPLHHSCHGNNVQVDRNVVRQTRRRSQRSPSATSIVSDFSDNSELDQSYIKLSGERPRKKQSLKDSQRQLSAESHDSGVPGSASKRCRQRNLKS